MLTRVTAEVSCDPVAMDPDTDPDRTVFFCRDTHPAREARAAEVHVRCSGALSTRSPATLGSLRQTSAAMPSADVSTLKRPTCS